MQLPHHTKVDRWSSSARKWRLHPLRLIGVGEHITHDTAQSAASVGRQLLVVLQRYV